MSITVDEAETIRRFDVVYSAVTASGLRTERIRFGRSAHQGYGAVSSSRFNERSSTKVPNGTNEAKKAKDIFFIDQERFGPT